MILSEHWPTSLEDAVAIIAAFDDGLPVVILYIRVSSALQVDENYSLDTQMESLRPECIRRNPGGCHLVCSSDEGISGRLGWRRDGMRESQYRLGLTLVKELVSMGMVQAVGVYKCNRFSRRLRIWLEFEEDYLDPSNVIFFSAAECIDTTDTASRMVFRVLMSGAEYELGQIAGGVKDGLRKRRDEGYYVGCPPYGWILQDERDVPDGCRISIEPVEKEAQVIRRMCDLCLDGLSPGKIAAELNSAGIPTATGGTRWTKCVVKSILRNPTNAGLIRDGSGGLVKGVHYSRRIIEPEVFCQVQARLEAKRKAAMERTRPRGLLFEGMLKCSLCGATLQLHTPRKHAPHYICQGSRSGSEHREFSIRVDLVESRLERAVLDSAAVQIASTRAAAELKDDLESYELELRKEARRLKDRMARNEADICLWAGLSGDPDYDPAEIDEELAYLARERKQLETQTERNRKETRLHKSRQRKCEAAVGLAKQFVKLWKNADIQEKRALTSHLVESFSSEPTDWGVTIQVHFITGEKTEVRFHVRAKVPQDCGDLWAIGPFLLTTAHYLRQGLSIKEIAGVRGITAPYVASQISVLRRITGCKEIDGVLEALAPVLNARVEELYLDGKKAPKRAGRPKKWTARQIEFLDLRTSGLTLPQAAKEMGLSLPCAGGLQMRVYKKLGAHSVADALAMAGKLGLLAR